MKVLDRLIIGEGADTRTIELWHGDLAALPPEEAVDILVVSAFPNDYYPIKNTLIGALNGRGISVRQLSTDKQADQRDTHSCWLSKEIQSPDAGFGRILCFEPFQRGQPEEVVGDIFRYLVPLVTADNPVTTVAMPVVSTGDAAVPLPVMFEALFNAAADWMAHGLPLQRLKIVTSDWERALELKGAFAILRAQRQRMAAPTRAAPAYDVFVSYCHDDCDAMQVVVEELRRLSPGIRPFVDRFELEPGVAWQQKLYRSIDDARKVMALYTPSYLKSKACQEEYNIARVLQRRATKPVLVPILVRSAELPSYMCEWQYADCREADEAQLRKACRQLVTELAAPDA